MNKETLKEMLNNTVPVSVALLFAFTVALGVATIEYYFFARRIDTLVDYKSQLEVALGSTPEKRAERLRASVLPEEGVNTGIKWEDLGSKLVEVGAIDEEKFLSLFKFADERERYQGILDGGSSEYIILTEANSRFVLNTLWALGLAQKSDVLTSMFNEYDQVANLASTGGWTVGAKDSMEIYGASEILQLSVEQQQLVTRIAENIYRPCCGNHTAFADCNHGMAMLGLLELMVANGYSEDQMYDIALKFNSYWFPDTYMTLAAYFETKEDTAWEDVGAKLALGRDYSSGSGYQAIKAQVLPLSGSGGGGCGV